MSVVYQQRAARRRWLTLWPLAVFLLLAAVGILWLWQAWPQVMMKSVVWQRDVNQQMSGLLKAVAANPAQAGDRCCCLVFSMVCCMRWDQDMEKSSLPPGWQRIPRS